MSNSKKINANVFDQSKSHLYMRSRGLGLVLYVYSIQLVYGFGLETIKKAI